MRRGLVLGKFAPLHRGHQLLIETARKDVDVVVAAVYETSWYLIPPEVRAGWIRLLYPDVHAVVVPDLPPDRYDETTISAAHAHDLLARLGRFTDVFTSEDYGETLAGYLGARHVCVDRGRTRVPISSTALREGLPARPWVDPLVYRSLVTKIALLGAESTGKTTLAQMLARRLGAPWVPEYGRELWEEKDGRLEFEDLERIADEQLRREAELAPDSGVLVCDTNASTTELWSRRLFGRASPRLVELAAATAGDYVTFLCDDDFDWVQDGTRESALARTEFHRLVKADLDRRGIYYEALRGTLDERVRQVEAALSRADGTEDLRRA